MNCDRIKDMVIEYLYGELPSDQAEAFQAHLKECPACADEVAQLGQIRKLASEAPDPEPSGLTMQRIVATAREEAETPKSIWSFRWFKVLATVCVMVIAGIVVMKTGIVTTTKVAAPPGEEAPALPPSGEMVASGPKETPPVMAKPASKPKPGSVLNGSTAPVEREFAKAETRSVAPRETEDEEKLYVIDRRSGEPIPVEPEDSTPLTRSAADSYVSGYTGGSKSEPVVVEPAPKSTARKSMDSEVKLRGLPSESSNSANITKHLDQAQTAMDSGQYGQAIQILNQVLNVLPSGHPNRPRALILLAEAYEGQGMKRQAAGAWGELAGESPEHADMARQRIEELSKR